MGYKKFPSEEECVKLLKEYRSIKDVLAYMGRNYDNCTKLKKIATKYNIKLNQKQKESIVCLSANKEDLKMVNNYKDNYEIGYKFNFEGHKWVIQSIKQDTKKLYHCINEMGFRGSFHAIDIN